LFVDVALARDGVEQHHVFLERLGLRANPAVRCNRDARSIEDQRIVAPYLVDVYDRPPMVSRQRPQHLQPQRALVDRVR